MGKLEEIKKQREDLGVDKIRSLPIDESRARLTLKEREITGYAIVWGSKNEFDEIVQKGATQNSLNARGVGSTKNSIVMLKHHDVTKPIAELVELREDDYGLFFRAKIIETPLGNETIKEINAGVLRQLSYGFNYIWEKTTYDEERDALILQEIKLMEISLVTFSADKNAQLRFSDFQRSQMLGEIETRTLKKLTTVINSELSRRDDHSNENRDDHSKEEDNTENKQKSNVKIF